MEPRFRRRRFNRGRLKSRADHAVSEAILSPSPSFAIGPLYPSGWIAVGAIALAAVCAVAMPPALAAPPQPDAAVLVPASLTPDETPPSAAPAPRPATELGNRIDSAPGLVVGGERLNVGLLRRFYAAHAFEPVWTTRQAQADSLLNAVLRAGDHGLDPELFHANLLRNTRHCRRSTANCCCRTPFSPMPTRWPAAPCRSSAG